MLSYVTLCCGPKLTVGKRGAVKDVTTKVYVLDALSRQRQLQCDIESDAVSAMCRPSQHLAAQPLFAHPLYTARGVADECWMQHDVQSALTIHHPGRVTCFRDGLLLWVNDCRHIVSIHSKRSEGSVQRHFGSARCFEDTRVANRARETLPAFQGGLKRA